jgi:hypothetical protein
LVDSLFERFALLARYPHAGHQRDDLWARHADVSRG